MDSWILSDNLCHSLTNAALLVCEFSPLLEFSHYVGTDGLNFNYLASLLVKSIRFQMLSCCPCLILSVSVVLYQRKETKNLENKS